jgi:TrmH family RNA methyltransferase
MVKFILNHPRNPKNIGAAARGMANFGFRDLAVVAPYAKAWRETRAAVQAGPVVENAKKFKTLKEALASSHVVVGTSAGSRRNLDEMWISLPELSAYLKPALKKQQTISVVFGSEKSGLSNEDLGHCHVIVRIPTDPECPSMNLAQAVAVVAYAIRNDFNVKPLKAKKGTPGVTVDNIERLIQEALKAYDKTGLLKRWTPAVAEQRIRKSFNQWKLSATDVAMLHGIFRAVVSPKR